MGHCSKSLLAVGVSDLFGGHEVVVFVGNSSAALTPLA